MMTVPQWVQDIDAGRSVAWKEDGTVVIRASACGACPRALIADMRREDPIPPSEWLQTNVFAQGHLLEPIVFDKLRAKGWTIEAEQVEFEVPVADKIIIRGRADAVVSKGDEIRTLEIKGAGVSVFPQWRKNPMGHLRAHQRYSAQHMAEMRGTGLPGLYAVHYRPGLEEIDSETGNVMRLDAGDLITFEVDEEPANWDKLRVKLVGVVSWYETMGEEWPECQADKTEQMYCFYSWLHEAKEVGSLDDADELVEQAWELKRQLDEKEDEMKELKRRYDQLRNQLLTKLDEKGIPSAFVNGIRVTKYRGSISRVLRAAGIARLKDDLGEDVFDGYCSDDVRKAHVRLSVPKPKEE